LRINGIRRFFKPPGHLRSDHFLHVRKMVGHRQQPSKRLTSPQERSRNDRGTLWNGHQHVVDGLALA
jgi:hypothetical protein